MKVLIAMDSFKGSLSSVEAGNAVRDGILSVFPHDEITTCPLADGGEGTVHALCCGKMDRLITVRATNPLGETIACQYGILENGFAVIEIAAVAGITLIPEEKRDPLYTTTYGVGEIIKDAVNRGCRDFIIGLGGSGTNDGGVGMLQALGWKFLDENGQPIRRGAKGLKDLKTIDHSEVLPELRQCRFRVACDVTNPLLGPMGCSAVFGPQKGADLVSVVKMDTWLAHFSHIVKHYFPATDAGTPGAGAAGGLGFAFSVFLKGSLEPGAAIVGDAQKIEDKIKDCDLIITGEGALDRQSSMGKGPVHMARLGKKYGKSVILLTGKIGDGADSVLKEGVSAYFSILPCPMPLQEAMKPEIAYRNLKNTASAVVRFYHTFDK